MRFILFGISLFLSMITFTIFCWAFGLMNTPEAFGTSFMIMIVYGILATMFILYSSKVYTTWALDLKPLDMEDNEKFDEIHFQVKRLALSAGIRPPEVHYFESNKPNALLIGYNKNKTIMALSTPMINRFSVQEINGAMASLIVGATEKQLQTKMILIALMNAFGAGFGKWLHDKIFNITENEVIAKVVYSVFFTISLLMFNLPTFIILRLYSKLSIKKMDVGAVKITSYTEVVAGLARIGTQDCSIGISEKYFSFVGMQKDKDGLLNPFGTIKNRINRLIDLENKNSAKEKTKVNVS